MKSHYMERALALAEKARGRTSPNPMVGAIVVKSGKIAAEGYHHKAGKDHAEIVALKKAKKEAKGATLYITLEPCCHKGKTPPCTNAIIAAGIKKVVIAGRDPNPLVSGKGIARLKKAGITVMEGLLQKEAQKLNEAYNKFITQKMPFVIMKAAGSLDGRIAASNGDSKWISNDLARKRVHKMREECDAVMVGLNTLLRDDPHLNVRPAKKGTRHPLRIIVDTNLKTPPEAKVLHSRGGDVLIASGPNPPPAKVKALEENGAEILRVPKKGDSLDLKALMKTLAQRNLVSVLLEGGTSLFSSAIAEGLVDKLALFYAPILLGGSSRFSILEGKGAEKISEAVKLKDVTLTQIQENFLVECYLDN